MADGMQVAESVARKYAMLRPYLDERQRRLLLGVEAQQLGRGGIKAIAAATGVHPDTVARGVRELEGLPEPPARVRAAGGGRKKLAETDPRLAAELTALVDPETRGDPMSPLVWTTKSTRNLAGALTAAGHPVSDRTVARMLQAMGFSLQGNAKVIEGRQHEDRDAQFRYLNRCVGEHVAAGQPVISVDTKKKELVGEFKNGGREYQPTGQPEPSTSMTSPTRNSARPSRTASTTCPPTPAGCRWAPTTTPLLLPCRPCAAGGTPSDAAATRTPTGC